MFNIPAESSITAIFITHDKNHKHRETNKQTNSPIKSILTLDNMHDFTCSDFTICQVVNK
jgi:hypothetical protein